MNSRPVVQNTYRQPLSYGWLRVIIALGPMLVLALVLGLVLVAQIPVLRDGAVGIFNGTGNLSGVAAIGIGTAVAMLLTAMLGVAVSRCWLTWKVLGVAWILGGLTVAWLAWDERTIRYPRTIADLVPAAADAEQSYAVLMRYSRKHPSPEARAFKFASYMKLQMPDGLARNVAPWREFLLKNRAVIEEDWKALAPQRAWLDELNRFSRIGDFDELDFEADKLNYAVIRVLSYRYSMVASLRALDGRGDEAIALLLPLLETSRKLRPGSRTLVRVMVAIIMEKMAYDTANFILEVSSPSEAARASLVAALADDPAALGAGNLLRIEVVTFLPGERSITLGARLAWFSDAFGTSSLPLLPSLLDFLDPILYNRVATANLYSDRVEKLAALADARELEQYEAEATKSQSAVWRTPTPKNIAGRMILYSPPTRFSKVLSTWWETEDKRLALRRRLEGGKK